MSIRVSTLCFTTCPSDDFAPVVGRVGPLGRAETLNIQPFTSFLGTVEASPIYVSVSTRLRITGGLADGYDGTATWTRVALNSNTGTVRSSGKGYDTLDVDMSLSAGEGYVYCDYDFFGPSAFTFSRDPKKQRVWFYGEAQDITSVGYTFSLYPPSWFIDGADPRQRLRWFGLSFGADYAVDSDTFTAAQWRDLRGTYSTTYTSGGVTEQYDWTIA